MRTTKSILLSILSVPLILAEPVAGQAVSAGVDFDFQELLAVLPAESLHAALHKHVDEKFQDGVYEHERIAVEKVHNEDPGTATKVLAEAALHLLKRQNSNDTIPTTTPTTTSDTPAPPPPPPPTSTITPSGVVIPIDVSTQNSEGEGTTLRTSAVATPTVSVEQPVTTTNEAGDTVVQTTTVPAAVVTEDGQVTTSPVEAFTPSAADPTRATDVTTTNSQGQTVVLSSVTPGEVITATDASGGAFVTTYTPDGGTVSSLVLRTTQLPNGQFSTITSFAVVAADTASSPSSTGNPRLQSGANSIRTSARSFAVEAAVLLGATFGASALFL